MPLKALQSLTLLRPFTAEKAAIGVHTSAAMDRYIEEAVLLLSVAIAGVSPATVVHGPARPHRMLHGGFVGLLILRFGIFGLDGGVRTGRDHGHV